MSISVQGYSGCAIEVLSPHLFPELRGTRDSVVRKWTSSPSYLPRLTRQLEKQARFLELNRVPRVTAPRVHLMPGETLDGIARPFALMDFHRHIDCLTFLSKAAMPCIHAFHDTVLRLLDQALAHSEPAVVPRATFTDKLDDVRRNVDANAFVGNKPQVAALLDKVAAAIPPEGVTLPIGHCHGDFTLSNMLVNQPTRGTVEVILVDFLDAFVETPLADIAKLAQDVCFGWTLRMVTAEAGAAALDVTRLFSTFRLLWARIRERFGHHEWYRWLPVMVAVNQLRVLQYSQCADIAAYLWATVADYAEGDPLAMAF